MDIIVNRVYRIVELFMWSRNASLNVQVAIKNQKNKTDTI